VVATRTLGGVQFRVSKVLPLMSTNPASLAVTSAGSLSDAGRKPRDSRTLRRYGAAVLLVVSALAVAVNRVVALGLLEDDGIAILREAAARSSPCA